MIEALKTLNHMKKNGVIGDYAIGGGYAVNYYLEPILTYDLDIYVLMNDEIEFHELYEYSRRMAYKIESIYIFIEGIPVQFLPSYIHPLIDDAVKKAKKIRVRNVPSKVLTVEHLIATLLMAFRAKDKMVIPSLMEMADKRKLRSVVERFSDEKTPLYQRFRKILESIR